MRDRVHRRYGWGEDIFAPRQEFATLAMLEQEKAIQEVLDATTDLTAENFRMVYTRALDDHSKNRASHALSEAEMAATLDQLALFGAQASIRARQASAERFVISFNCVDGPGAVAAAAGCLAQAGANIEGAAMSVVAEQLLMAFLVSGPAQLHQTELEGRLRDALRAYGEVTPAVVVIDAVDVEWPRPGSSVWRLSARLQGDDDLLIPISAVLAENNCPLLSLSSWIERPEQDEMQVVDLNFAVSRSLTGGGSGVVRQAMTAIGRRVEQAQLSFAPVEWPARGQLQGEVVAAEPGHLVITAVGQAKPGFVHHTLKATRRILGVDSKLYGTAMAILEGTSVLTLVAAPQGSGRPFAQEGDLQAGLAVALHEAGHPKPEVRLRTVRDAAPVHPSRDDDLAGDGIDAIVARRGPGAQQRAQQPTHELRVQVVEQPWVLAKVAGILAEANANITWLVSYVLAPMIGQSWPNCTMVMHIHAPAGSSDRINADLRSLADAEGWAHISLRRWSITAEPTE